VTDDFASPRLKPGRTLKTHERIGDDDPPSRVARSPRRLVIRSGSSPVDSTDVSPQSLQEAKPKAGAHGTKVVMRIANGNRSPEVEAPIVRGRAVFFRPDYLLKGGRDHPDENQSGRTRRHERHVGPVGQKCRDHPLAGSNLRRAEPHERRRTRTRRDRSFVRPGREGLKNSGSGTPR
jgi:hypothetical protein